MAPTKPQTRGGNIDRPTAPHVKRDAAHMESRTEDGTEVIRDAPRGRTREGLASPPSATGDTPHRVYLSPHLTATRATRETSHRGGRAPPATLTPRAPHELGTVTG